MMDTIKLVISLSEPPMAAKGFEPPIRAMRPDYAGYFKAVSNPSAEAKRQRRYEPRLTYTQRSLAKHELTVELSLPKLIFDGNNFDELTDADYSRAVAALQIALRDRNIWVMTHQLENAEVRAIHLCKNIVFTDHTSSTAVLAMLRTADISKVYDVQKTDFREGHVLHVHTNTIDIAFYDKLADLAQAKKSEKRAFEKSNYSQLTIFDTLREIKPLAVLRYELRLNGKRKLVAALKSFGCSDQPTLKALFSVKLSQQILVHHWQQVFSSIGKLGLDTDTPEKLLANILRMPGVTGPRDAAARVGLILLLQQEGADHRRIRRLFEDRFHAEVWPRLKPLTKLPEKVQYRALIKIDETLKAFEPVRRTHFENPP